MGVAPVELEATLHDIVSGMLTSRTRRHYSHCWQVFCRFAHEVGVQIALPISVNLLAYYIAYLKTKAYAPSTIATHISAISFIHKINPHLASINPCNSFLINKMIKTLLSHRSSDSRKPLLVEHLLTLITTLPIICHNQYQCSLFKAMFTLAFAAMLRISEITIGNQSTHTIQAQNVTCDRASCTLLLPSYKHSVAPVTLILRASDSQLCPVAALLAYLRLRGQAPGPLFTNSNGKGISRKFFLSQLNLCLSNTTGLGRITSHSFRIGGATYMSQCGYSDDDIRRMGRWRSDAMLRYIRLPALHVGPRST
jgi:site-specific recombinase XerD